MCHIGAYYMRYKGRVSWSGSSGPRQNRGTSTHYGPGVCLCPGVALDRRSRTSPDDPYDTHKPRGHIVREQTNPTCLAPCSLLPSKPKLGAKPLFRLLTLHYRVAGDNWGGGVISGL